MSVYCRLESHHRPSSLHRVLNLFSDLNQSAVCRDISWLKAVFLCSYQGSQQLCCRPCLQEHLPRRPLLKMDLRWLQTWSNS